MLVVALLALILLSVWVGLYQVVKQQGRIILRLDELEKRANAAAEPAEPPGLPAGTPFPAFALPDLAGKQVALEDFRSRAVLLIYWSPQCGFCDMIAPDLASLEPDFEKRKARLLLVAQGDAEANRKLAEEHGLKSPIVLVKDAEVPGPLKNLGTPSAYLLDAEGRIARPLAVGFQEVLELARDTGSAGDPAARELNRRKPAGGKPLSESRIVRDGLKAGTPAPAFSLPDLYGHTVALEEYRGRRVLLVFSDPHCDPCDQLAPELARFDRKHGNNGLAVIMIGRGDAEENRRKTEQHGLRFPVALQEKWKLSREYGIFSTPVAFLIGEDGLIEKDVAVGPDAIMELARGVSNEGKDKKYAFST